MGAPSLFLPDMVEAGLVALLTDSLTDINVSTIGDNDFNEEGELVLDLPAVRVLFNASPYKTSDPYRLIYDVQPQFEIWCGAQNLSSPNAQRQASLALAGQVGLALAGQQVQLEDGTSSQPIEIIGVSRMKDDNVGTIYVVTIAVTGIAQFNAGGN